MATAYMNLNLPTPSITTGPIWAESVNTALETVDNHDHSSGKGVKVKPNGMDINADLDMKINSLLNIEAAQLSELSATVTGPTNILKLHSYAGNLYFTNGSGSAVQLTSGGSIVASPGSAQIFAPQSVTGNLSINPSSAYVYLLVDTSAARSISLPFASAVSSGRIYIIKDISGLAQTNNITVVPQGSDLIDGGASFVVDINSSCFVLVSDGASNWYIS
jgi:hypothetical protein